MRFLPSSQCAIRLVTALKIIGGFGILAFGLVLAIPGVPGPGTPLVLLGLVLLSNHFAWARRSVAWLKQKTDMPAFWKRLRLSLHLWDRGPDSEGVKRPPSMADRLH